MKKLIFTLIAGIVLPWTTISAQVSVTGDGSSPDPSAMLDVQSTSLGILIPRMTKNQRTTIASPATGLLVYQTDDPGGFYYNSGTPTDTAWIYVGAWWSLNGNPGADALGNPLDIFLGTTDGQDLVFKTNGTERFRLTAAGDKLLPKPDNSQDLGSADFSFRNLYLSGNMRIDDSVFIDNAGTNNSFFGLTANSTNTGYNNTFLGYHAGKANTSGYDNLFSGVEAGVTNNTGYCNTASGFQSLYSNSSGWNNSAHGYGSLYYNSTGMDNSAHGVGALYSNTTGSKNSALGYSALYSNATGDSNVSIGYNANVNADNLSDVVVIGSGAIATASDQVRLGNSHAQSLFCMGAYTPTTSESPNMYVSATGQIMRSTSGGGGGGVGGGGTPTEIAFWNTPAAIASDPGFYWDNVNKRLGIGTNVPSQQLDITKNMNMPMSTAAVGNLYKSGTLFMHNRGGTYNDNTFLGLNAGNLNQTSAGNTGIGYEALKSLTVGGANTAVGSWSLYANTTGAANTALGYNALVSNQDGYSCTAVGYEALHHQVHGIANTAVGLQALFCNNNNLGADSLSNLNTAIGHYAAYNNTTGLGNTAAGYSALHNNQTGRRNTAIGVLALSQNFGGSYNTAIGDHADFIGGGFNFNNSTAVGANAKINASNKVRIGDNLVTVIEGQVPWSFPSDLRFKKNVRDISQGLDFILELKPVEYQTLTDPRTSFGFIAQHLEDLVGEDNTMINVYEGENPYLSIRITDLIAPMVKAIQEQQKMIVELQKRIDELESK